MPLSENELKQIDTDALKCSEGYGFGEAPLIYSGYIAGATAQAEKYQSEVNKAWDAANDYRNESRAKGTFLASRDSELRELRGVADRMADQLGRYNRGLDVFGNAVEALAAYRKIKLALDKNQGA
jgi:hypothetical protein